MRSCHPTPWLLLAWFWCGGACGILCTGTTPPACPCLPCLSSLSFCCVQATDSLPVLVGSRGLRGACLLPRLVRLCLSLHHFSFSTFSCGGEGGTRNISWVLVPESPGGGLPVSSLLDYHDIEIILRTLPASWTSQPRRVVDSAALCAANTTSYVHSSVYTATSPSFLLGDTSASCPRGMPTPRACIPGLSRDVARSRLTHRCRAERAQDVPLSSALS